ncbi:MAG: cytochrome c oxidase subunit 3 [Salinisphaera sp.]|nr:cytochrome c oxidase subunit 3 [Salinisphaera sp.]
MTDGDRPAAGAALNDPARGGRTAQPHLPAEEGLWVFLLGDMCIFALLFGTYIYYRADHLALYAASQAKLNPAWGAAYTLLLLTGSWFVVQGVTAVRRALLRPAAGLFAAAMLCGLGFLGAKLVEYGGKLAVGITPVSNDFFMYYYILTGLHFVHVLVGVVLLGVLIAHCRGWRRAGQPNRVLVEGGACYWHMVDLLWIVLFPLLYLFP